MIFTIFSRLTLLGRRWYFHASTANWEVILQSEGYRNHGDALAMAETIKARAGKADIDDSEWESRR